MRQRTRFGESVRRSGAEHLAALARAIFQSGMNPSVVERKWEGILQVFEDFDVSVVSALGDEAVDRLCTDARVIRNRRKISAIITNARRLSVIEREHGSVDEWLDQDDSIEVVTRQFASVGPTGGALYLFLVGRRTVLCEPARRNR